MTRVEAQVARLLRWYPRRWRATHGEALAALVIEDARRSGHAGLALGEAWSMRTHGLVLRASPGAAAALAGVAALAFGASLAIGRLDTNGSLEATVAALVASYACATLVAMPLAATATIALLRERVGASPAATVVAAASTWATGAALLAVDMRVLLVELAGRDGAPSDWVAPLIVAICVATAGGVAFLHASIGRRLPGVVRWACAFGAAVLAAVVLVALSETGLVVALAAVAVTVGAAQHVRRRRTTMA